VFLLKRPVGDVLEEPWLLAVPIPQFPSESGFHGTPQGAVGYEPAQGCALNCLGSSSVAHLEPLVPGVTEIVGAVLRCPTAIGRLDCHLETAGRRPGSLHIEQVDGVSPWMHSSSADGVGYGAY
jgi:hypothetical protein